MEEMARELDTIEKGARQILSLITNYEARIHPIGEMINGIGHSLEVMRNEWISITEK